MQFMNLNYINFLIGIILSGALYAVDPNFEWGFSFGGTYFESPRKVAVDHAHNVIITGYYNETVDFDPSEVVENRTSSKDDIFIQKLSSNGDLIWVKTIGGSSFDVGFSHAIDSRGNIYVTGYFNETVDFDPNSGVSNLTAGAEQDLFILKLSSDGELIWVKQIGSEGYDSGRSIALDLNENIYVTGHYTGTVDFDPGPDTFFLNNSGIFVLKLDHNGNFIWAKNMSGGKGFTRGESISTDQNNNVYVAGRLESTVDFDPGPEEYNLTSNGVDSYILKLTTDGDFVWAKQIGGEHSDILNKITVDKNNNVLATGYFIQNADFDPGPAVVNLTNTYSPDIFILKLNSDGEFVWVRQFGGESSHNAGENIATDILGNVYVTGAFDDTIDFNPGIETNNLIVKGSRDSFLLKLDSNGDFVWVQHIGGDESSEGGAIAVNRITNGFEIYVAGVHRGSIDLDPTEENKNYTSIGLNDYFILKIFESAPILSTIYNRLSKSVMIYPNPASDYLKISGVTKATNYIIYSSFGHPIIKGTISVDTILDLQDMHKGLYFLTMENGNSLRFIKE